MLAQTSENDSHLSGAVGWVEVGWVLMESGVLAGLSGGVDCVVEGESEASSGFWGVVGFAGWVVSDSCAWVEENGALNSVSRMMNVRREMYCMLETRFRGYIGGNGFGDRWCLLTFPILMCLNITDEVES